jgi:ppGpp synthetase/RelA/SpoT-type nucleotidyltranferase
MILEWILFIVIAHFIFTIFSGRTLKQNEYLLNKIIRRLEEMPSKAELDAKIQEIAGVVDAGFQKLGDTLTAEIQQVKDAIAAGADTTATIAALDTLETNLQAKIDSLNTGISDVVTP